VKFKLVLLLSLVFLLGSCKFMDPDEKAVSEMLLTFTTALDQDSEDLAKACLMDDSSFKILNPDASARMDPESFIETVIAALFHDYRDLAVNLRGKDMKMKGFTLGHAWFQYKGRQAFKDNILELSADGAIIEIPIAGIVKVNQQWRIVDLSGIDF